MHKKTLCGIIVAGLVLATSGCVHYRDVTFTVRDKATNTPIPNAWIRVEMLGEVLKLNCGKVPLSQSGVTNDEGEWTVTVPMDRYGSCDVESTGYIYYLESFHEDALRESRYDVMLSRNVPTQDAEHHQDEANAPPLEELENDDSSNGANQEIDPEE